MEKTQITFFDLTTNLKCLLAQVSVIKSSYSWNKYCIYSGNGTQEKIYPALDSIHHAIIAYINQLQQFTGNPNYRVSSKDVEKFLNGDIINVRKMAIDALNFLQSKSNATVDDTEKELIDEVVLDLRNAANQYLGIARNIIENNPKIQELSNRLGVDYVQKYELNDI